MKVLKDLITSEQKGLIRPKVRTGGNQIDYYLLEYWLYSSFL